MSSSTTPSPQNSSAKSSRRSSDRSWRSARLPALLIGIILVIAAGYMYWESTLVSGTELNSHTWEIRNFQFRRDPFTQRQLTGLRYSPYLYSDSWVVENETTSLPMTTIKRYLTATSKLPQRWDLVRLWDRSETRGPGSILVRLVETPASGSSQFWVAWTIAEGPKAAELWPAAQQLVMFGLYPKLPDLFELALYEKDDTKFKQAVAQLVQAALLEHSRELQQKGEPAAAQLAAQAGLVFGEHPELQAMSELE